MPAPRVDWSAIELEYVTGPQSVTIRAIAEQYGLDPSSVMRRSTRCKWVAKREEFRRQVAIRAQEKLVERQADLRARHVSIAKMMQAKALNKLTALDPNTLDNSEVRHYLRDAAEIERRAVGVPEEVRVTSLSDDDLRSMSDEQLEAIIAGKGEGGA